MDMPSKDEVNQHGNIKLTERDGRKRLLERLEAENAQLRESVVELALQIRALRDRARTLTA
jgi:hypothetical protein